MLSGTTVITEFDRAKYLIENAEPIASNAVDNARQRIASKTLVGEMSNVDDIKEE